MQVFYSREVCHVHLSFLYVLEKLLTVNDVYMLSHILNQHSGQAYKSTCCKSLNLSLLIGKMGLIMFQLAYRAMERLAE